MSIKQKSLHELNRPDAETYRKTGKLPVVVVLDNIRSGLNVGAIFRTCDAFSIEAIYLCGITVRPPHAEILKTALGSTDSVKWTYFENTMAALDDLQSKKYLLLPVEQTDHSLLLDKEN